MSIFRSKKKSSIITPSREDEFTISQLEEQLSNKILPNLEKIKWNNFMDFLFFKTEKLSLDDLFNLKFTKVLLQSNYFNIKTNDYFYNSNYREKLGDLIINLIDKSFENAKLDETTLKTSLSTFLYFGLLDKYDKGFLELQTNDELLEELNQIKTIKQKMKLSKRQWRERYDFTSLIEEIKKFLLSTLKHKKHQEINRLLNFLTVEKKRLSSSELVLGYYVLKIYILSKLSINFPLILDEPFGRYDVKTKKLLFELLKTLPQVIILCQKDTLPEIPANLKVNLKHYDRIFHEITLNLFEQFINFIKEKKWELTEGYIQLGSQVYKPDYVIKSLSKDVLVEFKNEITTNVRIRLLEAIRSNEKIQEGLIISPQILLWSKRDVKHNKIATKEYQSNQLITILDKITHGEEI
ncbi:MAG: hypothetical protein ACTSP3_11715 [Candidatus Heimdallarchaeaceae archaeon]